MKTSKQRLLSVALLWLLGSICLYGQAQKSISISGTVVNEKGEPISSATIIATDASTFKKLTGSTDSLGQFFITNGLENHVYDFKAYYVGYDTGKFEGLHLKEGQDNSIFIRLNPNKKSNLDEVVVVGYGTQRKGNLTGAVAQVSGSVLENRSLTNVTQGLQGQIPNLNLVMGDGKPTQSPAFNVRGNTSIGQGGSALVLIDGVQGDPSLLNPNDVASVTVLKDASSAAVYGARAAFGVVLITTKTPKKGRISITYSSDYSSKSPSKVPDIVSNGYQYASSFASAWSGWNDYNSLPSSMNKTQKFSQDYLNQLKLHDEDPSLPKVGTDASGNYVYYGNTNWYDLLYKKHLGAMSQNISINGSSEKVSYYLTGRYYGQDGLFRYNSDKYHMYNLTGKGSVQATAWLQITNTTQYSNRFYHNPTNSGEGGSIWRNLADEGHPTSMLYNPDGSLTYSAAYTVGDFVYGKNHINTTSQFIKNTTGFVANILKNQLSVRGDFTFQNTTQDVDQVTVQVPYNSAEGVTSYVGSATNYILVSKEKVNYLATNLYADYEKKLSGGHEFKLLLGYNYEQSTSNLLAVQRNGLLYSGATNINLASGSATTTSGDFNKWAILGGFYRLNYNYKNKYLVELDGRYDGSSKFPNNQRFGFFPSASGAWHISNEGFWKVSSKFISDLKLRGSLGGLGNGNVNPYSYMENFALSQSGRVILGNKSQKTSSPNVLPSGLTWEKAITADIGLDAQFLSNRLSFTADIYRRTTKNMFTVGPTLPDVFGASSPYGNYADLRTDGFEFNISWSDYFNVSSSPFHYNIAFWMSDYQATITRYNNVTGTLGDYYVGEKLGTIWGYTNDGYWTAANVGQAAAMQSRFKASNSGTWLPGDIKFKDINGDGVINNGTNTVNNHGDLSIIGNETPRYSFGFKLGGDYKGFFLNAFFMGVLKQNWWPGAEADNFWGQYNRPYNYLMQSQVGNMWSEDNVNAYFPRLRGYVAQNSAGELYVKQSKYLQNARYIKLKNVQIGYNVNKEMMKKLPFQSARIYFSGENLWSASPLYKHMKSIDVENIGGSDADLTDGGSGNGNNYPMLKSYTVGVLLSF